MPTTTVTAPFTAPLAQPAPEPFAVSPKEAQRLLGIGNTHFYKILPELDSYFEGAVRRITVESIRRRIARKLTAAPPTNRKMAPRRDKKLVEDGAA